MTHNDRGFRVLVMVFIAAIVLSILGLWYGVASAQDTAVYTHISAECIEYLSPVHYRLHFGYTSTGTETFAVAFDNLNTTATLSIGNAVTTELGTHELGYLDAFSPDSPYDFTVTFTGANDTFTLRLNTWDVNSHCAVSTVAPDATPEPAPETVTDDCPAWSYESATGNMICLWSLPRVGSYQ